jgi:hypothetical protein
MKFTTVYNEIENEPTFGNLKIGSFFYFKYNRESICMKMSTDYYLDTTNNNECIQRRIHDLRILVTEAKEVVIKF